MITTRYRLFSWRFKRGAILSCVIIAIVLFVTISNYMVAESLITDNITGTIKSTLEVFDQTFYKRMKEVTSILYRLSYNPDFNRILSDDDHISILKEEAVSLGLQISKWNTYKYRMECHLYLLRKMPENQYSSIYHSLSEIDKAEWFRAFSTHNRDLLWLPPGYIKNETTYSEASPTVVRAYYGKSGKLAGVVSLSINAMWVYMNDIFRLRNTIGAPVYIVSSDGLIVCSYRVAETGQPITGISEFAGYQISDDSVHIDTERIYITRKLRYPEDWRIVAAYPTVNLSSKFLLPVISVAVVLLFSLVVLGAIQRKFNADQIKKLAAVISESSKYHILDNKNQLEVLKQKMKPFLTMSKSSLVMANTINKFGYEIAEIRFKELRAKVNPHFLYNQLDAIYLLALQNNSDEVADAVMLLAQHYRSRLVKNQEMTTIEDELEQVITYIKLMEPRTRGKVKLILSVPDNLKQLSICSLTFQPIVENALIHGIFTKDPPEGEIGINIRKINKDLEIIIWNNGTHIPPGTIDELNSGRIDSENGSGFGSYSVRQRIATYYGDSYGISYSQADSKLQVRIIIPVLNVDQTQNMDSVND